MDIPAGLKHEDGLIFGMRPSHPGLFEIKFHVPKKKNALSVQMQEKFCNLVKEAEADPKVKCIMVYGGSKFFSSGNDISVFLSVDDREAAAEKSVTIGVYNLISSIMNCKKPTVFVDRGPALGIAFTIQSHADFIYCTPEATFQTPFMKSFQSPEGCSTLTFPEQLGPRLANEVLMLDKKLTAEEAHRVGFVNAILPASLTQSDFFDPNQIPAIPKLLATDYTTLLNCKDQINLSKDLPTRNEVVRRENAALKAVYLSEEFPKKMMNYMMSVMNQSKPKM